MLVDRLSIGFASNLHRICIGFAMEEHWRINGGRQEENRKKLKLHISPKAYAQLNQHNIFNYALNVLRRGLIPRYRRIAYV